MIPRTPTPGPSFVREHAVQVHDRVLSAGMKPFAELSYDELLTHGYIVVGSPGSVADKLGQLQSELGFGQLIGLFALGDMPHERVVSSMELKLLDEAGHAGNVCQARHLTRGADENDSGVARSNRQGCYRIPREGAVAD